MSSPTLIAFSEADSGSGTATSKTSASLTWQTGDILVLLAVNSGGNESWSAPSNTGSGLSWVQQQLHNSNGTAAQGCGAAIWTATASSGSSGTVTANLGAADQIAIGVYQVRAPASFTIAVGHSNVGFGLTGATSETVAITMSSADSMVCWGGADFQAGPVGSDSPAATSHNATTPGPSATPVGTQIAATYTFYFADLDDEVSTGSQNFGFSGLSTADILSIAAVEIKLTAAAGGGTLRPVLTRHSIKSRSAPRSRGRF